MFSTTKSVLIFFCLIFWSNFILAQKTESKKDTIPKDDHYGIFELGPYYPLAFGKNSASKAFKQKLGGQFVFVFNLFDSPFLLGLNITSFESETTSEEQVGNYYRNTVTIVGPVVGYHILMKRKWRGSLRAGVGYVSYRNFSENFSVRDTGSSLWFTPSLGYQFTKNFGLYVSGSYRHDFLNIDVPSYAEHFFNSINYVTFSAGVRIVI